MATEDLDIQAVIGFRGVVPNGLRLHPDGEHLVFPLGSCVVIRNILQRTQTFLQGHDNQISAITLSASGKYLASGQKTFMGFPADMIIWDFESRKATHRLRLHKVAVQCIAFSPSEQFMASLGGQDDNSIVIWEVESGTPICGTPAATEVAKSVTFFSKSDFHLASGGQYHVRLWNFDLPNKKLRPTGCNIGKLRRTTLSLLVHPEDTVLYCGTQSGDLLEVGLERGLFKKSGPPKEFFKRGITCSVMIPNGDIIIGTGDGTLAKLSSGTLRVRTQNQVLGEVTSISLTPDGSHFFCGTSKSNIYWVDCDSLMAELRTTCHSERINAITFPFGYSEVFATCSMTDIRVWNAKTRQELLRIQVPNLECHCVAFMRDGKSIVSGWSDGKIRGFLPQSGRLMYAIHDAHQNGATALACTSDCGRVVSGGMNGEVRVWKILRQTQTMEASLKEHRGRVWCLKIRENDQQAVSASSDGSVIVWDLNTFTRVSCLFDSTMFKALVYHPDESQILTTGSDRKLTWWDAFDGQPIRALEGSETGELTCLAITRSGSHFLTGGEDKLARLWDYDEGVCKHAGLGHSGGITACAIAPDQSFAVTCGQEGAIFMWKIPEKVQEAALDESGLH